MTGGAPIAPDFPGRLTSALAAGIDELVLRAVRAVIDRTLMPAPAAAGALREEARFYAHPAFTADPRRFFPFLARPEPAPRGRLLPLRPRVRGSECARVTFRSPYRPVNPAFATAYAATPENHWVHAELWCHRRREPTATAILLHGFGMGHPRLDASVLMAPAIFDAGLDVVLVTLPLHGRRSPAGTRFSGQCFASPDVARLNEAIAQAAHDVAALIAWLRTREQGPIGLLGLSLGGYVAALMAALRDDLAFVVPVIAPVCFGDLAWRFMRESALYREGDATAIGPEDLRAAYRVHSPLAHAPRVPPERLFIVAGRGDRVVPAAHPLWLHEHWGRPRLLWFSGSHLAPFGRIHVTRALARFFADLGLGAA